MNKRELLTSEIAHGEYIAQKGETVWNWSSPAGQLRWRRRASMFTEFLGKGHKKVLEIGCGTGLFTSVLAATGHQITAIDISLSLLELARERVAGDNVIFANKDAHETGFDSGAFDFIVGSSVLHHLDLGPALKEFFRILKPGGRVMFTEPNMLNPQIALERNIPIIRKLAHNSPNETAFFRWSLKKSLENVGFKRIDIAPFDFMHPAIPQFMLGLVGKITIVAEKIPIFKEIAGSLVIKAEK